jgi:hypothetical protein
MTGDGWQTYLDQLEALANRLRAPIAPTSAPPRVGTAAAVDDLHAGADVSSQGFTVAEDLSVTDTRNGTNAQERAARQAEMAKFAESRAVIEQAKGMLMGVYGIGANSAFELLKWRSQEGNVKLRLVAEQITHDFVALAKRRGAMPGRSEYDDFLLTVDLRITDAQSVGTAP